MGKLEGKIALVTGASRGIGRGIAIAFAAEGASVIVNATTLKAAEVVAGKIKTAGGEALPVRANVSKVKDVKVMIDKALRNFGRIDILVNNAGICPLGRIIDTSVELWDRVIAVNLKGVFLCTKYVLPSMMKRRYGRIINIASQLGYIGAPECVPYSASKGGVIAFTRALAREVAPHITVNAIAPGPIETDMLKALSRKWRKWKLAQLPLRRFGEIEDVVPSAVFLASDDSNYYTGQTLNPNGGDVMP